MAVVIGLHALDNTVGQVIHRVDQEVARTHGRVADLDTQEGFAAIVLGRIELCAQKFGLARCEVRPAKLPTHVHAAFHSRGKALAASLQDGVQRVTHNVLHDVVRRVIGTSGFALALVVDKNHPLLSSLPPLLARNRETRRGWG